MNKLFLCVLASISVGAMILAAAGCGSGNGTSTTAPIVTPSATPTPTPNPTPTPVDGPVTVVGRYQNLVFTLSAPKQVYTAGDTATLIFTVQNIGGTDVTAADAAFFAENVSYTDAKTQGLFAPPVSGVFRLFPTDTVFKAGQSVTRPIDFRLTAFVPPLTYRTIRVYIPAADSTLLSPSVAAATDYIGLTVQ